MRTIYEIDAAMCGSEFKGDVRKVAQYLTDHGYPSRAITDSYNGAKNTGCEGEPPESVWLAALEYAEN